MIHQEILNFLEPVTSAIVLNPVTISFTVAAIVLLVGFIIGRILGRLTKLLLKNIHLDENIQSTGIKISIERIIAGTISFLIYAAATIIALDQLKIAEIVINVIVGILLLAAVISAFLALKDVLPNIIAGMTVKSRKQFKEGDKIKIGNIQGKIQELTLTGIVIKTPNKDLVTIPNAAFLKTTFWKKTTHER